MQEPSVLRLNYGVYFNKLKSVSLTKGYWMHTMVLEIPTIDHFQKYRLCKYFNPEKAGTFDQSFGVGIKTLASDDL